MLKRDTDAIRAGQLLDEARRNLALAAALVSRWQPTDTGHTWGLHGERLARYRAHLAELEQAA